MPRVSNKESKNIYFSRREELKLTRDQASELLESIPPERIEKIENERVISLKRSCCFGEKKGTIKP